MPEPYFNEPGVERSIGTTSGIAQSRTSTNGGWEPLRVKTMEFGMVDMLRHPPEGFEGTTLRPCRTASRGSCRPQG